MPLSIAPLRSSATLLNRDGKLMEFQSLSMPSKFQEFGQVWDVDGQFFLPKDLSDYASFVREGL